MKKGLLKSESLLIADHGVGLTGSCGPIGEYSGIEAVKDGFDEGMGGFEIDLSRLWVTFSLVWLR